MPTTLIQNGTIISSEESAKKDLFIKDGIISLKNAEETADRIIDADGLLIFPAFIDCHVHFREPGNTHKADMESESCSALAGGVTTVCEMPNTNPPTVSIQNLKGKVEIASEIPNCDIRFFFGVTEMKHIDQLSDLFTKDEYTELRKRCCGVKVYFDNSTGNQKANEEVVEKLFEIASNLNIPVVAHCEDAEINDASAVLIKETGIQNHSLMRPPKSEIVAIEKALSLVRKYGTRFHVAHLSTAGGLSIIKKAKKEGFSVTCEVAPHHLFLDEGDYVRLGALGKMNPPLRKKEDRQALLEGVNDGTVDCVSTDHAPHTLEEKNAENPLDAPSGVPGVETLIPLLLTAASKNQISYEKIHEVCFVNPNKIFNLRKEEIVEGSKTKIVLIDPNKKVVIHGENLKSKCGWTPFEGMKVMGQIVGVI